ncbi:transmembrane protein [Cyclospora cayetanensis]|uniref:Transmembrane protein n=1 Tax=Cyclospora cayetanensis TaxID=88456 RepID=A0A1D3CVC2_9EIME|nr:transmembrane protein [Cyclospora cayetanensis]
MVDCVQRAKVTHTISEEEDLQDYALLDEVVASVNYQLCGVPLFPLELWKDVEALMKRMILGRRSVATAEEDRDGAGLTTKATLPEVQQNEIKATFKSDNRVSFPSGREELFPLIPHFHSFLVKRGIPVAVLVAVLLLLPVLQLLRIFTRPFLIVSGFLRYFAVTTTVATEAATADHIAVLFIALFASLVAYCLFPRVTTCASEGLSRRAAPLDRAYARLYPIEGTKDIGSSEEHPSRAQQRHIALVLINPASGAHRALQQYRDIIAPTLHAWSRFHLLPVVLQKSSMHFLYLLLFAFAPLFSHCLLLGGDGSFNTVTKLLQEVTAARGESERAEMPETDEDVRSDREIERECEAEAQAKTGIVNGRTAAARAAPAPSTSSHRHRPGSIRTCRASPKPWKSQVAVTPVPVGTSNTWCSEFLFSEGAVLAGKDYIAETEAKISRLVHEKEALQCRWLGGPADGRDPAPRDDLTDHVESPFEKLASRAKAHSGKAPDLVKAERTEERQQGVTAWPKDVRLRHALDYLKQRCQRSLGPQETSREEMPSFDSEEAQLWDEEKERQLPGLSERDRALAAASRAVRKHSTRLAKTESSDSTRQALSFVIRTALELERTLLHPMEDREEERKGSASSGTVSDGADDWIRVEERLQDINKELAATREHLGHLNAFVRRIGPGKDAPLNRLGGALPMLHYWCRRISEGQSAYVSIMKVIAGDHINYCVNSLEFGYLGTCMVHSEDLRWTGHYRYLLSPLYQFICMKTQSVSLEATLPNGKTIYRKGAYLSISLDLVQHWTDDVCATPWAQLNSDFAWLLLIKAGISPPRLMSYSKDLPRLGPHCKGTERLPVTRVRFELPDPGIFGLDGEVYRHQGSITLEVLSRAVRVVVSRRDVEMATNSNPPRWSLEHIEGQ